MQQLVHYFLVTVNVRPSVVAVKYAVLKVAPNASLMNALDTLVPTQMTTCALPITVEGAADNG